MHKRLTALQRAELTRRLRSGEGAAVLAEAYGVSERSIWRAAREVRGVTLRTTDPTRSFSFRASASEVEAFEALAREAGLGRRGTAFRVLLRMASGLVEVAPEEMTAFNVSVITVTRQGALLNQIAKRVNMGQVRLTQEDRVLLRALLTETLEARAEWGRVLEGARARQAYASRGLAAVAGTPGEVDG